LPVPPWWLALPAGLGALVLALPVPWTVRCMGLPLLLALGAWRPPAPPPGQFELIAADIGQGNAVLVRTHKHTLLYDAGPRYSLDSDAGQRVLVPMLQASVTRLDRIVLSHRDSDHVGGAASVLTTQPQADVWSSLEAGHALLQGRENTRCQAGQSWEWDGVRFSVLHPAAEAYSATNAPKPNTLSCVLRVTKHSGFAVGLSHITDVLTGSANEKIKKWGHDTLSTYGIGKGRPKAEWLYYGRELLSLGLMRSNPDRFNVVEVTPDGMRALREKQPVQIKAPLVSSRLSSDKRQEQKRQLGAIDYDHEAFEKLRIWRINTARAKGLPAYMVFSDSTLQMIAAKKPSSLKGLSTISGIGDKKLSLYGQELLEVLR
jgi:hypothetical protein